MDASHPPVLAPRALCVSPRPAPPGPLLPWQDIDAIIKSGMKKLVNVGGGGAAPAAAASGAAAGGAKAEEKKEESSSESVQGGAGGLFGEDDDF